MKIRELERREIRDLWSIDRAEVVEGVYRCEGGELVLKLEHFDDSGLATRRAGERAVSSGEGRTSSSSSSCM